MIKAIEFPNQVFENKEELFAALLKNEKKIIGLKKAHIFNSEEKEQLSTFELLKVTEETKSELGLKDGYVYAVINTTKYRDSHKDVHFDGIWDRSIKDTKGKLFYVADHNLSIDSVIVWPEDLKAEVKTIPWSFVGKNYEGNTQALIFIFKEDVISHEKAKEAIQKKRPVQNSVRMRYITIKMGINSAEKDYTIQKAYYDSKINDIANKEEVEKDGYFFGVEEAEISKEGSMVLFGSNDATPTIYSEAADSTSNTDPQKSSQEQLTKFINPNLY